MDALTILPNEVFLLILRASAERVDPQGAWTLSSVSQAWRAAVAAIKEGRQLTEITDASERWRVTCAAGSLAGELMLMRLRIRGCPASAADLAAGNGHVRVVEGLLASHSAAFTQAFTVEAMNNAAANGHLEVVALLHAHHQGCTIAAMGRAAEGGHLGMVQWLHANRQEGCSVAAMNAAAGNSHMEVVQWLHANRREGCTAAAMNAAARNGDMAMLQWLHDNHPQVGRPAEAIMGAVESCHLEVARWLQATYPADVLIGLRPQLPAIEFLLQSVATKGDIELARWLHSGYPASARCTRYCLSQAAIYGHFGMVRWLVETYSGVLDDDMLQWAIDEAKSSGQAEIALWLEGDRTSNN